MDPQWFASPVWCGALTLSERNKLLTRSTTPDLPREKNSELGQRRLNRWRTQAPFSIDAYFAQSLALDGITQERLLSILSEPVETFHELPSNMPTWLAQVEDAYVQSALALDEARLDEYPPTEVEVEESTPDEQIFGFLELIQPLVDQACQRLQAGIADLLRSGGTLPFDPETIEDLLLMNLSDPLLMRLSRTLVLELHVARLQGKLDGDTPKERFESFIYRLRQPDPALTILAEYPVLTRQITICLNQWTEVCLEFLNRLCDDWQLIRSCFRPEIDPGVLAEVAGGAGDTHRGGRSVMIATFESGFRIVYKPKSLKIDTHFQELLTWLNDKGCEPPLQTMTMLNRGDYGWVEFVAYRSCSTIEELERFFQRHGAYLALLYALNSNDFHYENVIAVGEHPLLIDLETLLQPTFDTFDETQAVFTAEKTIAESVLQVGLLPLRLWSNDDYGGIDISGLGGMAGQLSPDRLPQITDVGTDAMRYVRQRIEIAGDANRPSLNGVEVSASDHVEEVVSGFTAMYRLLLAHRDELLAGDGPIARFSQDEIRVLLRPTRTYDQLLTESFHPDLLRDALDRDLFLNRLWMATTVRPYLAQVIGSERFDLQRGDIPIFTTHPTSLELYGAFNEGIGGVLNETGMKAVYRRIGQLSDQDLQRQVWFIRASIATLEADNGVPASGSKQQAKRPSTISNAHPLSIAQAVADHLASTAIYGDDDVTWIGMELVRNQNWAVRTLGVDLYGGLTGIALFLAYAGDVVGNESYTLLARRALKTVVGQIEFLQTEMGEIGGFEGWGGLIYALTHLRTLWDDLGIAYQAKGIVEFLATHLPQDDKFDIGRGSAGAIVALLTLHGAIPYDKALDVAIACGDHLLASAKPTQQGLTWSIPSIGVKPKNDFLHGNMGIAWALSKLAAASGNQQYAAAAEQAIAQERSLRSSVAQDQTHWLERASSTALDYGLAGLCMLQGVSNSRLYEEVQIIVQSAMNREVGWSHALDNGEMGTIEFLLQASHIIDQETCRTAAERIGAKVVDDIARFGWQCSGPSGVEMPSFMLGIAGIGYGMLRLAEFERVPSILTLAPPIPPRTNAPPLSPSFTASTVSPRSA